MSRARFLLPVLVATLASACAETPQPAVPPPPAPPPPPAGYVEPAPAAPTTPDADFRKQAPTPGPDVVFVAPAIQELKLKNGVRVLFVERHDLPIVSVRVVSLGGASEAAPGVAGFAGALLLAGTKTKSSLVISDTLNGLGADFGVSSDHDATFVSLQVLGPKLGEALPFLADAVLNASFPKEEVERERDKRLTSISQEKDSPQRLLGIAQSQALYPASHPYASTLLSTESRVRAITPADLSAYHRAAMTPGRLTITACGDVTRAALVELLEKSFGALAGKAPAPKDVPDPPQPSGDAPRVVLVDRPGATQTSVSIATVGVARKNPDYDALLVMNTILGGQFASRLNMNLREKHAYTYGARSGFDMRRGRGPFSAGAAIVRESTAPAIKEALSEIERMRKEPVTDEELADAKSSLVKRLPGAFETTGDTAGTLAWMAVYGLPLDEYATRPARIAKITKEDVQRVATTHVDTAKLRIVMVGDAAKIRPSVEALGLGGIEARSAEQVSPSAAAPAQGARPKK